MSLLAANVVILCMKVFVYLKFVIVGYMFMCRRRAAASCTMYEDH